MPLNQFEYWIDANLPPALARWLEEKFSVTAFSLEELGLLQAIDKDIYTKASQKSVVIITKDEDFTDLLRVKGPPPKIIWVTIGNISNQHLKQLFLNNFEKAVSKLEATDSIVEITTSI